MGLNMSSMLYLQSQGLLTAEKNKILDIGPQNVYFATAPEIVQFVEQQGARIDSEVLKSKGEQLVYFSTPRPGERTTFFSEIADLTNIEYLAIDVCPAPNTEVVDLNFDRLPERYWEYFDVVLDFGTTEHIFNQWNSFEFMHDSVRVGGAIYCVLPASGYLDHGYYCYTPLFFNDFAKANNYEIIDLFVAPAGLNDVKKLNIDVRNDKELLIPNSAQMQPGDERVPCFNIHAVLRKTKSSPFRVVLEVATSHAAPDGEIGKRYQDIISINSSELERIVAERNRMDQEIKALRSSTSWWLTAPLRQAVHLIKAVVAR